MPIRNATLRERYRDSQNGCELALLIHCCNGHGRGLQIHHILRGPDRHDIWSNFLLVCEESHRWCHQKPIESRIACWLMKARKGEFDIKAIRKAWRQCPLAWIDYKACESRDARCLEWVAEIFEGVT